MYSCPSMSHRRATSPRAIVNGNGSTWIAERVLPPGIAAQASRCCARLFGLCARYSSSASASAAVISILVGVRIGRSARIGAAATVAQPQADEMAPAVGRGVVDESGAAVAQRPVVDELDLPRFEVEIDRQFFFFVEDIKHCLDGGLSLTVDRLAAQCVSAIDLMDAEPRLRLSGVFKYRR